MQLKNNSQRKDDNANQPMPVKPGPRSSKGAAKREQILSDLMLALADGSLRNPSLREIGQALGIEPAHILYYFESREALLQAAIIRWDEEARARVGKSDRSLQFTLEDYVAAVTHNINRPGIVHLYLSLAAEAVDPAHPAHDFFERRFERVRENLACAVRREQSDGRIANTHDSDLQARLFIALADGLQLQSLVDPQLNAAKDLEAALSILRCSDGSETNGAG
jgi:AcrR family transcriptional regulator